MITPSEVARITESNRAIVFRELSIESTPCCGGVASWGGPGVWSSVGCGMGLDGPVEPGEIDRLVGFYAERGGEPSLQVCPYADRAFVRSLGERGFVTRRMENLLYVDLSRLDEIGAGAERASVDGLTIEVMAPENIDLIREAATLVETEFCAAGQSPTTERIDLLVRAMVRPCCVAMLARIDGEPVASGSVEIMGEQATLYALSVRAPFRRRGVQAAMIRERLRRARDRGARIATIESNAGAPTERNAIREGFRVAYTSCIMSQPGEGLAPLDMQD